MIHLSKGSCLLTIIFLIIIGGNSAAKIEIKCPEFCECDVFQNLRRASCQNRRLVSIELNVPSQAQILDISDNQISELGDKIFLEIGLTELKLLNLSHNKVRQIHFNGFEGLENLKTLDLSFNAIQYFTKSWFLSLSSLQELYLRGNKLKSINDEPLIDIATLRVLDLSKCGITSLTGNIFTMVPNLEILDLSDNYLQRLKVEILKPLSKLTLFKVQGNDFNCKDRGLINTKNYIKKAGISYRDPCIIDMQTSFTVNSRFQKFEKIVMAPDVEATTSLPKNFWIFDNEDVNNTKIIEVCSNVTVKESKLDQKTLLMHIMEVWPLTAISVIFVYGVLSGMVIICAINLCIRRRKVKNIENVDISGDNIIYSRADIPNISNMVARRDRSMSGSRRSNSVLYTTLKKAKRQMSRDNASDDEFDDSLVMNEFDLATSTPMQERKTYS